MKDYWEGTSGFKDGSGSTGNWSDQFGVWGGGGNMLSPNRVDYMSLMQAAGLSDKNNPNQAFNLDIQGKTGGMGGNNTFSFGQLGQWGGGVSPGNVSGGGQGGGIQPQNPGNLPVNSQLSGANLGLPAGQAPAYTITGAAGTGTAAAPGGAAGFWKGLIGNQRLITGVVSAVGTMYGQYDQKKKAQEALKWQNAQLDARRQYEQERINQIRNSPMARLTPNLMALVAQVFGDRLKKRGINADSGAWINAMFPGMFPPPAPNPGGMQSAPMPGQGGQ